MNFELADEIIAHIESCVDEAKELLRQICLIPAPSHHEEKRAEFIKNWLEEIGAKGTYIDDALNVVYPVNCNGRDDITVFMAHTDTVFPDLTEPMPYSEDDKNIYSPGVGDDTFCLVAMLMAVKYIVQNNLKPNCGILFVANSCEEGLGNLKGVKQIMNDYSGRVKELYTFDGQYTALVNKCVGSHRYKIVFETEGGHSFNNFGNSNAIHAMSELICNLYSCKTPEIEGTKTTYNVGVVSGGTSVNTIAQQCEFLYEYRSDSKECLDIMQAFFEKEIEKARNKENAKITVELIGERPCANNVDEEKLNAMSEKCVRICEKYSGMPCITKSGSTDCNIPQSLGVPAVCPGVYIGGGVHTREEWLEKASVPVGMKIAFEIILEYFNYVF
ncbi:MAG: M20/M25/M40 family metallo-hydrolase [Clostridia bacterium]|nr:M20/M25/M40 family metallo-hydrolase [Clostridia bacterium]